MTEVRATLDRFADDLWREAASGHACPTIAVDASGHVFHVERSESVSGQRAFDDVLDLFAPFEHGPVTGHCCSSRTGLRRALLRPWRSRRWLHELLGTHSTRRDLVMVQGSASGVAVLVSALASAEGLPLWTVTVLALFAADVAGGVGRTSHRGPTRTRRQPACQARLAGAARATTRPPWLAFPGLGDRDRRHLRADPRDRVRHRASRTARRSRTDRLRRSRRTDRVHPSHPRRCRPWPLPWAAVHLVLYVVKVAVAFPLHWYPHDKARG